ncbi:MAG TPA: SirB2 family protein, partial [Casimicrobiaceae bacterium]
MSVSYSAVKHLHVSAVVVSLALFTLRGAWMLAESDKLRERWVRIVPHVVDTLLLLSALWLAWQIGPEVPNGWLVAKV